MPDCRKPLVAKSGDEEFGKNIIVGEMAHIVGETNSKKSPRGISPLTTEERNGYPNFILLCEEHHTIIDQDEETWPIEKLHIIKRQHEIWVEERLNEQVDLKLENYFKFVELVSLSLHLTNWEWLCDCLFRQIMPVEFPEGIYQLRLEHYRAIFSGENEDFEKALGNLVTRCSDYVDHYMSNAIVRPGDPRIMARKEYKELPEGASFERRQELIDKERFWERNCTYLLCNLVLALNEFADVVRKSLDGNFFAHSKFCVHDFMGMESEDLTEMWIIPESYYTDADLEAPVEPWLSTGSE